MSPLYVASQEGCTEVVDTLLKSGADPNLTAIVRRLVHFFIPVQCHMYITKTPYFSSSFFPFILSCLQADCSVPLEVATQNGHIDTVERLLEGGAYINHKNNVRKHMLYNICICFTELHVIIHDYLLH